MAKVVTEVAVGAAAIGLAIAMPGIGAGLAWMTLGMQNAIIGSLVSLGGSMILGGVADALQKNQGGLAVGVTTPIGPWAYVYGTQKVGGVEIFRESNSSQGTSNNKELHRVYVLACHPCQLGSWQLRIDGRQVLVSPSGTGWASHSPTQISRTIASIGRASGVVTMALTGPISGADGATLQVRGVADNTFNGTWTVTQPNSSDPTTLTYICGGPDASSTGGSASTTYSDYKDKIYLEFLNGNHTATFPGLLASGTTWSESDLCLGRTVAYVRMGYDEAVFPSSIPNVSFVIDGKNDILDPRTGLRGFTQNAALCIADFMSLPSTKGGFRLAIGTDIPSAQLIAAANICDEAVPLVAGGTVPRYTCNTCVQLNTPRGTILKDMLSSCAGRISYQGGQYSIFPAAWVAPTLEVSDADIVGPIKVRPRFSIRDTFNAVKGTYVSPENAYQQGDVPAYMQDVDHGYVTDPWLAEDHGERIFKEANFPCTDNSATAQRLEKIALLRTRYQQRVTIPFSLKAYQAVAIDAIRLTHPRYGWSHKTFEVLSSRFILDKGNGAPRPYAELDLAETDSSIYDWSITEQLTPQGYRQPNNVGVRVCAPPEHVSAYSGPGETIDGIVYPSTITTGADGRVQNSIYVRWTQPNDANVVFGGHIEVQYQLSGVTAWTGLAKIDPTASSMFIGGVSDGATYNVQVRAVNCAGVPSDWVIVGAVTVSDTLSVLAYSGIPVAPPGTLTAQALSDGTAQISVANFTAQVGAATAACTPSPAVLTGCAQAQLYYVYYVDPNFVGGAIAPVATQNVADFENRAGYFYIGSLVTPSYAARYQPSSYSDVGSSTTINASAAYDNNINSDAYVTGSRATGEQYDGDCIWQGFPNVVTSAPKTLYVVAAVTISGLSSGGTASALITAAGVTLLNTAVNVAKTTYTHTIGSGTNLSGIAIEALAQVTGGTSGVTRIFGFEIWIQ